MMSTRTQVHTSMRVDKQPESGYEGDDLPITEGKITELVKQLLGGRAPEVDEVHPEFQKVLDVVRLSSLKCLCNIAW